MGGERNDRVPVAIFGSGRGSTARALLEHQRSGEAEYHCVLVISDRSDAGILAVAQEYKIPALVMSPRDFSDRDTYVRAMLNYLAERAVIVIALAGYLRKVPSEIVAAYANRIVNIHPALLPKFGGKGMYGINVHRAVLDAGEHCSGATIHRVTEEYDAGEILEQVRVPIFATDTPYSLMERVQTAERWFYPRALDRVCWQIGSKKFWL
ncbi:MAG: phosphoribosylglycinamide formyltransferase [Chlorobi bacterium]|nr:phosphoribosylglycinamide formyltransferase [Chlorobiota bacterium]